MHRARVKGMQMNTQEEEGGFSNTYHSDKKAGLTQQSGLRVWNPISPTGAGRHHPEKLCSFSPLVYSCGPRKASSHDHLPAQVSLVQVSLFFGHRFLPQNVRKIPWLVSLEWRALAISALIPSSMT